MRRAASLLLLCVSLATVARGAEWQPAVRLNPDAEGWFPDVTADRAGRAHVVWSSGPVGGAEDMVHHCSPTPLGCHRVDILMRRPTRDGVYAARPIAVTDQEAVFHLLWRRKAVIVYTSAPLAALLSPDDWLRPRKLGTGSYNTLGVDPRGSLHAAWSEPVFQHEGGPCDGDVPCYGCADISYSRSDDGGETWTLPVNLSRTIGGSEKPHFAFAPDGMMYLAWEEGRDHYVGQGRPESSMLVASSDHGQTWSEPVTFTLPDDVPQSIAVGVDGTGRVVVVWQQIVGTGIYFQTSSDRGRTWSAPQAIPGILRRDFRDTLDDYDMTADSQGHLHLVLTGRRPDVAARDRVFHLEWNGRQWSAPAALSAGDDTPEWPRITVGNGNELHAVWFERTKKAEERTFGVWYARGRSDAPYIEPLVWPDAVPPRITRRQWLRLVQTALAVMTLAAVILTTRRFGW